MNDMTENQEIQCPDLTDAGKVEFALMINSFKEEIRKTLTKVVDEVLDDAYCDIAVWIESDAWCNFRNAIEAEIRDYPRSHGRDIGITAERIREGWYKKYKDQIVNDRIADLERQLKGEKESYQRLVESRRY